MSGPVKASLEPERGEWIPCLFNPAELTISKSNSWTAPDSKGTNAPNLRFQTGQSGTMTMSLTLDTTDTGTDVTEHANALLSLLSIDKDLPGSDAARNKGRPPWVKFHWGRMHSFAAVVERVQIKYTFFASNGMPLRAKADLSLKQFRDDADRPLQNPTSYTPHVQTVHRVVGGESLDRIAAAHYADPTRWRLIADANAVLDPRRIVPGQLLVIPELPVRRRA